MSHFHNAERFGGYTGKLAEDEIFPRPQDNGWQGVVFVEALKEGDRAAAQKLIDDWAEDHLPEAGDWSRVPRDLQKQLLFDWTRQHQPEHWNPEQPLFVDPQDGKHKENLIADNLRAYVAEALGLEDDSELKFYSAAQTPVDTLYGVDGWFEYRGTVFTVDTTANPHKTAPKFDKADYILRLENPEDESELKQKGSEIARWIKKYAERAA